MQGSIGLDAFFARAFESRNQGLPSVGGDGSVCNQARNLKARVCYSITIAERFMKSRWVLFALVFILAILACSLPGGTQPAVTDLPPTSTTQPPTPTPIPLTPDALGGFTSYRMVVDTAWERDEALTYEGTSQAEIWEQEVVREPFARSVTQFFSPGMEEFFIQVGDRVWSCPDAALDYCTEFGPGVDPFNPLLDGMESLLAGAPAEDFKFLGEEVMDGFVTQHLEVDYTPLASAAHWDEANRDSIEHVRGEVWIVSQPGMPFFVLAGRVTWDGFMDGSTGSGVLEYRISDLDAPFVINPPVQ
jgi:hypothetical protein